MSLSSSERTLGIVLALIANSVWGFAALYWIETKPVAPIEVLAHRGLWTLPAVFMVVLVSGRLMGALRLLRDWKTMRFMAAAAALVSVNWGTFLWAVTNGRAAEASLGYFLLPLLSVVVGVVIFDERLNRAQLFAVVMAVLGIGVQVVALGAFPVVSLALSVSFAAYGAVRKFVPADSIQGLFIESLFLFPVALTYFVVIGGSSLGAYGIKVDTFLVLSGAFTAIPLLTHVAASRLLPMSTVGLLAYIGPTLQLFVATQMLNETVSPTTWLAFAVVWLGLVAISLDNLQRMRRLRRANRLELGGDAEA